MTSTAAYTPSFKNITIGAAGLLLALSFFFTAAPHAHAQSAPSLSESQIQAVLNLLTAFGVDPTVITSVSGILHGTTGSCTSNCGSPSVTFEAAPTSGPTPLSVSFVVSGITTNQYFYRIEFGDGSTPYAANSIGKDGTTHSYTTAGTYMAKLTQASNACYGISTTMAACTQLTPTNWATINTATITVGAQPTTPTCSISYLPASIAGGQDLSVSWSAHDATSRSYSITNADTGALLFGPQFIVTGGTRVVPNFSDFGPGAYLRTDTVVGRGGTGTCSARLVVTAAAPTPATQSGTPSCTIAYSSATLSRGQNLQIAWSAANATSRSYTITTEAGAYVFGPQNEYLTGNQTDPSFKDLGVGAYVRTDTVTGPGGTATCTARLQVVEGAPSCNIAYAPSTIARGQNLQVSWSSSNATSRTYSLYRADGSLYFGPQSITSSGAQSLTPYNESNPAGTYTRRDTVTGPGGTATCSAPLTITASTGMNNGSINLAAAVAAPFSTLVDIMTGIFVAMGVR